MPVNMLAMPARHRHEHSAHAENGFESAFPPEEENLVLDIIDQLSNGTLELRREATAGEVGELEERYGFKDVWLRLGAKAPSLGAVEYASVVHAFCNRYEGLPVSHPRYEHAHEGHHHEGHHDCGKIHGPLRQRFDRMESRVLGKISNRRAHALAAAAFRLSALTFCPGDDVLAIGAQTYGAVSGHGESHGEHHEERAVLPRRPRIDFELDVEGKKVTASAPLDAPVPHDEIPDTKAGKVLRQHLEDVGPGQHEARQARLVTEAAARPEKRRRRRRVAALGALALATLGVGVGDVALQKDPPKPTVSQTTASLPDTRSERDVLATPAPVQVVKVTKGDSQWRIAEKQVEKVTDERNIAVINAATSYAAFVNGRVPGIIEPGERLLTVSPHTVKLFSDALKHPENSPELARNLQALNEQTDYMGAGSSRILKRIDATLQR